MNFTEQDREYLVRRIENLETRLERARYLYTKTVTQPLSGTVSPSILESISQECNRNFSLVIEGRKKVL